MNRNDGILTVYDMSKRHYLKFYGEDKYWNMDRQRQSYDDDDYPMDIDPRSIWESMAQAYGPPAYYIAQIQQQMLALNAPYGFFAVIFDKGWEFAIFKVYSSNMAKAQLITEGYSTWNEISRLR
jgi:hypothetical protein